MAGVEVAGLILGALPLMITALDHYRESAEVLEGWWKIKTEYRKCKAHLNFHKTAFEQNLEELLLPLIADEEKLKLLLDKPGGPEWKDPELEILLMKRMPKTYSSYLDTIEMMMGIIENLNDALGTNKAQFQIRVADDTSHENTLILSPTGRGRIPAMTLRSLANLEYQTQRIKLAFNKTTRKELFADFGSYNTRLRDILGSSDRLAGLRRIRQTTNKQAAISFGLSKFWTHAHNVFDLLTGAWTCQCQVFHHANLLLQHRVSSSVNFNIAFWYNLNLEGRLPWTWQDTSIMLIEDDSSPVVTPNVPHLPSIAIPTPTPSHVLKVILPSLPPLPPTLSPAPSKDSHHHSAGYSKDFEKAKDGHKSTRLFFIDKFKHKSSKQQTKPVTNGNGANSIAVVSPAASSIQLVVTDSPTKTSPRSKVSFVDPPCLPVVEDRTMIKDLCSTIGACSSDLPEYGCLKGPTRQYIVQPLCIANSQPQKSITLGDLLCKERPIDLSRRQRYHIALVLASSYIQLHRTPWLKSKWSKKDIIFLYDEGLSTICLDQPYVSQSLCKKLQKKSNETPAMQSDVFLESIRNLGIMLVELCFGAAIEDYRGRISYSGDDEKMLQVINYDAADKWSRFVVEEAGLEFSDAVTWCLHSALDSAGSDGKEDKWREDMFGKVVEPLTYCHNQLMKL